MQRAAVRLIASLSFRHRQTALMQVLHWLPIAKRIKYKFCLMVYAYGSPEHVNETAAMAERDWNKRDF